MGINQDEKSREELKQSFFELELLHLVKSGNENPKIIEHFMGRVRKFLELPEDAPLPAIALGDVESMRNLAGVVSRLNTDIKFIEERVNKLKKELGQSEALNTKPSPGHETPAQNPDEPKHGPRM